MDRQVQDDEAMGAQPGSRAAADPAQAAPQRPRRRRLALGLRLLFLAVVLVVALVRHFQGPG